MDAFITNEILEKLSKYEVKEALCLIKFNFDRLNGFQFQNSYRKIPRDALRVGLIYLTSKINLMIVTKIVDRSDYHLQLIAIFNGLTMLEKNDVHRKQIVSNLRHTLEYCKGFLDEINVFNDIAYVSDAIEASANFIDPAKFTGDANYKFEVSPQFLQSVKD